MEASLAVKEIETVLTKAIPETCQPMEYLNASVQNFLNDNVEKENSCVKTVENGSIKIRVSFRKMNL